MVRFPVWQSLAFLVALGAGAGCANSPKLLIPAAEAELAPPVVKPDPSGAAVAATRCGDPIPGWKAFARPGRMVVLGEFYGSKEIPAFLSDAACQAAEAGHRVHVGLEIAKIEQRLVDEYLESDGGPEARARLLDGGMWHRMYEDGKSSTAIFDVIERARALRAQGLQVDVHYYDELGQPGSEKEARVAQNLAELWRAAPRDFYVVLTGNVHARTVVGVPWDEKFTPMAYHLLAAVPDVVSLDAHYSGGESWNCTLSRWGRRLKCGPRAVALPFRVLRSEDLPKRKDGTPMPRFAGTWGASAGDGYHGIFYVGKLTPAQPATEPGMALR